MFATLKAFHMKAQGKRSATLGRRAHAATEPCKGSIIRADLDGTLSEFNFSWVFLSQGGAALTLGFNLERFQRNKQEILPREILELLYMEFGPLLVRGCT